MRARILTLTMALLMVAPATAGATEREAGIPAFDAPMLGSLPDGFAAAQDARVVPFLAHDAWPADVGATALKTSTSAFPFLDDVDGDGLPDILVVTTTYSGRTLHGSHVEARAGVDGRALWNVTFGPETPWLAYLLGDVTGDGVDDIAFVTYEDPSTTWIWPPPEMSGFIEDFTYLTTATRRLLLVDGADGGTAWETTRPTSTLLAGRMVFQANFWAQLRVQRNLQTNAGVDLVGDMDGDGAAEILWQPWDLVFSNAQHARTTHVTMLAGADGAQRWTRPLVGSVPSEASTLWHAFAGAYVHPIMASATVGPDANGDGLPDLYTSELRALPDGTSLLQRSALDARDARPLWVRVPEPGGASAQAPIGGYLALEGAPDRVLWTLGGAGVPLTVQALRADSGTVAWSTTLGAAPVAVPLLAGDATDDGREDVLVASLFFDGVTPMRMQLLDGAHGGTRWSRDFAPGAHWSAFEAPGWDHDGDGARDLLVWQGSFLGAGRYDESWTLLSLADGGDVWASHRADVRALRLHASVPDLTDDGLADVVQASLERQGAEEGIRLAALEGASGATVWTRDLYRALPAEADAGWSLALARPGDTSGDGAADLLLTTSAVGASASAPVRIETLEGANGLSSAVFV